jgi:hypothetical protein
MSTDKKQDLLNRIRRKKLLTNADKDNESSTNPTTKKIVDKNESKEDWLTK